MTKLWLSPQGAANLIGEVSAEHVRVLIRRGALAALDVRAPGASRPTYRIRRADALFYGAQRFKRALAPTTPRRHERTEARAADAATIGARRVRAKRSDGCD